MNFLNSNNIIFNGKKESKKTFQNFYAKVKKKFPKKKKNG
jgi:hypothetical protein